MARGCKIHAAGIVAETEAAQDIQLASVQTEAGRAVAGNLCLKFLFKKCLCLARFAQKACIVHAVRRRVLQAVQGKAMAAAQIALQTFLFALCRPADGKHCRADLVFFQQADVFVQSVQHILRHRFRGICHTFRVREFLDVHGEHGVLFSVLHDSLSVFYSAGTALSILLHPHRKVNRKNKGACAPCVKRFHAAGKGRA